MADLERAVQLLLDRRLQLGQFEWLAGGGLGWAKELNGWCARGEHDLGVINQQQGNRRQQDKRDPPGAIGYLS